jgi:hypothetical protein
MSELTTYSDTITTVIAAFLPSLMLLKMALTKGMLVLVSGTAVGKADAVPGNTY